MPRGTKSVQHGCRTIVSLENFREIFQHVTVTIVEQFAPRRVTQTRQTSFDVIVQQRYAVVNFAAEIKYSSIMDEKCITPDPLGIFHA